MNELFFLGQPKEFKPGIKIFPPTVSQVVTTDDYGRYLRLLTYSQEEIEDEFLEAKKPLEKYPNPFEFMLGNSYNNKDYERLCKKAFYFFIHQEVTFLYGEKIVVVGNIKEVLENAKSVEDFITIKEEDFFEFQNLIRLSVGKTPVEMPNPNEDPRVAEIKRKARYRDKLKAKKAAKSKDGVSLFTMLVSICCMGIGITPLNIGEMSYVALQSLLRKYQEKEKYQLDIDSLLAGADSKKVKPKYWIRNFEE